MTDDGVGRRPQSCRALTANEQRKADHDAEVDFFFDVPVNVARESTGYRHDEGDYTYEVLEPVPRKGWLPRLFGAR